MFQKYFRTRAARKRLRDLTSHARGLRHYRRDLMPAGAEERLAAVIAAAERTARRGTPAAVADQAATLEKELDPWPPPRRGGWSENYEVLLVAFGVAMAFRCYFFQPFKIPTGSMQPTLYGIHSEERAAPGWLDRLPLKPFKWIVTGDWYREVRVGAGGQVIPLYQDDRKPGYIGLQVAGRRYYVPADAVRDRGAIRLNRDMRVESGALLWAGIVHSGDHVFVNRVAWNFRRPRRGEVMVFSTRGIRGLPPGTHYIKRMTGLPGQTLAIQPPDLLVNGQIVTEPYTVARVARREKLAAWAPPYAGYQLIGEQPAEYAAALRRPGDQVVLGADEYYAMGDNTLNSRDSRYWGPVPERNLLGPACLVYWPFLSPRFGAID
ncbi:MAG: signal peptidase I [Kiritimatiellae bacterium]|nr:signal peptidase I [Kiritimatiellia bacterium]